MSSRCTADRRLPVGTRPEGDGAAGPKAAGVRDVPVERITDVLCYLVYGTMFTNYFTGGRRPLDAQVEDLLDISFNGILTESERRRREGAK